jgi:hypothetical protein
VSDLLVIEFHSEEKAEGVREILLAMHKEYLIEDRRCRRRRKRRRRMVRAASAVAARLASAACKASLLVPVGHCERSEAISTAGRCICPRLLRRPTASSQ